MKNICVLGLGYIGLPTASLLATKGYKVLGVDIKQDIIDTINKGDIHIVEPDLDVLVKSAVHSGNLRASLIPERADVFIIAVPTPFKDGKKPDLSYVERATDSILSHISEGNLIIIESTSPVGTTQMVAERISKAKPELISVKPSPFIVTRSKIFIAYCPERVLPGQIMRELIGNDRVIGGLDTTSAEKAKELYSSFIAGNIYLTNAPTAEMVKLTENAYRDVNIAFANELSLICEEFGISVWDVIELSNKHPRVNILKPGPGVGGHCIAVDPWFIIDSAPKLTRLIKSAREVNDYKPTWVVEKVRRRAERFKSPVIGCLGLSYKNDIDDLRESPSLEIVRHLAKDGIGKLLISEPYIKTLPESLAEFNNIEMLPVHDIIDQSDIIVALVNHKQFSSINKEKLKEKIVIDLCGIWR